MDYGSNGGIARRRDRCSQYVPGSFPVRSQLFTPLVLKAHGCSQCSGRCPPAPYIQFRSEADSTAKATTGNSGTVGTSLPCNKLAMEQSGNRGGTASFAACEASTLMSAQSVALIRADGAISCPLERPVVPRQSRRRSPGASRLQGSNRPTRSSLVRVADHTLGPSPRHSER